MEAGDPDPSLERLYRSYSAKQKRAALPCFIFAAFAYDVYALTLPSFEPLVTCAFIVLWCVVLVWTRFREHRVAPHVASSLFLFQVLLHLALQPHGLSPRDSFGWVLLLDFLIYVALPLPLRFCLLFSVIACILYFILVVFFAKSEPYLLQQLLADAVLLINANILGAFCYGISDKQQRTAFLGTRQCLEMKLVIEEQSAEQERLLLSVLPEHVAVKMRQDLGSGLDSQFKKIYMSRHENVSILYADIVGFTAISSTYSASELVKILNELFATFDRLSERYEQLRIKILGDCYYCISGAPRERPDHAILSVYMGLSMVKAIKYVQQKTNSPVDMRVGIHTGAVLAGVLGQRQWQFDVYSKDVELANKMESSGLPGRVHVSEKTLSFLDGAFEVEPAYGEKREETLRLAGIKTYFIVEPKKAYQSVRNGVITDINEALEKDNFECTSPDDETSSAQRVRENSENFKKRLKKDLMNKDGQRELSNHISPWTLRFRDTDKEKDYNQQKEASSNVSILVCPIVLVCTFIAQTMILPRDALSFSSFGVGFILIIIFTSIIIADILPAIFPNKLVKWSESLNSVLWARRLIVIVVVIVLGSTNLIDSLSCLPEHVPGNCTRSEPADSCVFPSYFTHMCALVLIATALLGQLCYLTKAILLYAITVAHSSFNIFVINKALYCEEYQTISNFNYLLPTQYTISEQLLGVMAALAILGHYMEKASRVLYLWKIEAESQQERASDIRRRNEALVYNILPPHVATHFLGNRKRQHEELYSQSYAEVGVLFASMPNFSDFYSEETVNNQGLECLRFLNEVISDFDALLEQPQYQDIIKIKTIGSTYMAASGLNPTRKVLADDPIEIRWAHLSLLVEFALDLKKALQSINEQSFNHFVLKMGINHGPITAGVIGARKPHYDIWGNSVNVASRMESTGKAGCIQVTQETSEILQHFGYKFEQRGLVAVKGKGQLMTYYLIGRQTSQLCMEPKMETLKEEDEEELEGETEETQVHLSLADSEKEALLADKPPEPNEETT
ncbi:adenylate cyclase type 3 [Bemisia tabaci]|nr:PREDICTED: adenylate cyclase type 3 [Bemisia tabaci]